MNNKRLEIRIDEEIEFKLNKLVEISEMKKSEIIKYLILETYNYIGLFECLNKKYTYIIKSKNINIYKIGYTSNIGRRLNHLQSQNATKLKLYFLVNSDILPESTLKDICIDFLDHGEWYIFENETILLKILEEYIQYNIKDKFLDSLKNKQKYSKKIKEKMKIINKEQELIPYNEMYYNNNHYIISTELYMGKKYINEYLEQEEDGKVFIYKYNSDLKRYIGERYNKSDYEFEKLKKKNNLNSIKNYIKQ